MRFNYFHMIELVDHDQLDGITDTLVLVDSRILLTAALSHSSRHRRCLVSRFAACCAPALSPTAASACTAGCLLYSIFFGFVAASRCRPPCRFSRRLRTSRPRWPRRKRTRPPRTFPDPFLLLVGAVVDFLFCLRLRKRCMDACLAAGELTVLCSASRRRHLSIFSFFFYTWLPLPLARLHSSSPTYSTETIWVCSKPNLPNSAAS